MNNAPKKELRRLSDQYLKAVGPIPKAPIEMTTEEMNVGRWGKLTVPLSVERAEKMEQGTIRPEKR